MERFQESRDKARQHLRIADHMVYVTYPLVKDSKLLLAILDNIFLALTDGMASVLYYERLFKRIPPFHDTFESKFNMFQERVIGRRKISLEYLQLMRDVKNLVAAHKSSPAAFARNDKFIIYSADYNVKGVSLQQIKEYVEKTKMFLKEVEGIVSENEGIFK